MGVECGPTGVKSSEERATSVDKRILELRPGCLDAYLTGAARTDLLARHRRSVAYVKDTLRVHLPAEIPLLPVAANYAVLSLRHDYTEDAAALAYPLFLLAAWLWDDIADTNKGSVWAAHALSEGLPRIVRAVNGDDHSSARRVQDDQSSLADSLSAIMAAAQKLWRRDVIEYAPRIESEVVRFFASFLDKVKLTHRAGGQSQSFEAARAVCVGMQPCYEMAYAFKARSAKLVPREHLAYLAAPAVGACADAATLHCAAVNDLFSMYKDRCLEDTANFPAVFGHGAGLSDYFNGAVSTVSYARRMYDTFRTRCARLPPGPGKTAVVETWEHMMEGNFLFHLLVPRYREGVTLVQALLDPDLTGEQQYVRFAKLFEGSMPAQAFQPRME